MEEKTKKTIEEEEEKLILQLSEALQIQLFCSGVIFHATVHIIDREITEEQLIRGLWVSLHSRAPLLQRAFLRKALSSLGGSHHYEQVQSLHKRTDIWAGIMRWYRLKISSKVPDDFPLEWSLIDACSAVLDRMEESDRIQVFNFD